MTSVIDTKGAAVIIGGGLAGLTAALSLAPEPVVLLSKAPLGVEASSPLAQGGIAAALGPDDNTALHLADTIAAGDGLCDKAVARAILAAAPSAIEDLMRRGVPFDRDSQGRLTLGLEAAHSRHRIIHASGDASGREIMRALICRIRETPSITVFEGFAARRLIIEDNRLRGIAAQDERGFAIFATGRAVIATGGTGGLFVHSTNPPGSWGQGLALAAKAGVLMADLAFVQFHPTALDSDGFPPKRRACAARYRRARHLAAHRGGSPGLSRCAVRPGSRFCPPLPGEHGALPSGGNRSSHPANPGAPGGPLSHGRH